MIGEDLRLVSNVSDTMYRTVVILNPISGARRRRTSVQVRSQLALRVLKAHGVEGQVLVSERRGHAYELAKTAISQGARLVFAWGGDGTVNEVARALVFQDAALGIIPAGSGNGLAREFRIDRRPEIALQAALRSREKKIDAGEIDGNLLFNVGGIGFDAHVASSFNSQKQNRRGLLTYIRIGLKELLSYCPAHYEIYCDGRTFRSQALFIVVANARQWGNGARIAPQAKVDDGLLDLVIVERRSPLKVLWQAARLFTGNVSVAPGITTLKLSEAKISSERPICFHVDGEPMQGGPTVTVKIHPGALRVRVGS